MALKTRTIQKSDNFLRINYWTTSSNFGEAGSRLDNRRRANTKTQCPKSSRFQLVKMMDRGRVIQPESNTESNIEY